MEQKTAFVTVGSTRFDALVQALLREDVIDTLVAKGYNQLDVQCGHSDVPGLDVPGEGQAITTTRRGLCIRVWTFKPSLEDYFKQADLVISHAGSGTIIEVLRMGKPLIVVPNSTLMDDHQSELASALDRLGHLKATHVNDLAEAIAELDTISIVPFPDFVPTRFSEVLDKEMGFAI